MLKFVSLYIRCWLDLALTNNQIHSVSIQTTFILINDHFSSYLSCIFLNDGDMSFLNLFLHMRMCVCVCAWGVGTHWGQKMVSDRMELELQATVSHTVWVLGPSLGSLEEQQVSLVTEPSDLKIVLKAILKIIDHPLPLFLLC